MQLSVFDIFLQPILICQKDGKIVYSNDASELTFGLSGRQLKTSCFPHFLGAPNENIISLSEVSSLTRYQEVKFDTGKKKGSVNFAVQSLDSLWPGGGLYLVNCYDATVELTLQTRYKNEKKVNTELVDEILAHRADLLLSQDQLKRKVSQLDFLLEFQLKTRFLLEPEKIAQLFLEHACETLGFMTGFHFNRKNETGHFHLTSCYSREQEEVPQLITEEIQYENTFDFNANVKILDQKELDGSLASALYQKLGISQVVNAAVLTLRQKQHIYSQCHLINFAHTEKIDPDTLNLLESVMSALNLIFENAELFRASTTDELTQVNNLRYFRLRLQTELSRASRDEKPVSLLMFDIDHFKKVNDTFGHQIGDRVISRVANCIKSSIRSSDIVARYGGEEFVVILPATGSTEAYALAEKIRKKVEMLPVEPSLQTKVSVGISSYPEHATNVEKIIECADRALYVAKNQGRNKAMIFQEKMFLKKI